MAPYMHLLVETNRMHVHLTYIKNWIIS
uniref:Uncharacterized protein n=1 Tax=Arundo donax TaxID=35708 RepID=A0A0A9GW24_ARUDO